MQWEQQPAEAVAAPDARPASTAAEAQAGGEARTLTGAEAQAALDERAHGTVVEKKGVPPDWVCKARTTRRSTRLHYEGPRGQTAHSKHAAWAMHQAAAEGEAAGASSASWMNDYRCEPTAAWPPAGMLLGAPGDEEDVGELGQGDLSAWPTTSDWPSAPSL